MWNKDEVKGKIDQAKGDAKRVVGRATQDAGLRAEGGTQKLKGRIQEGFGTAKRKVGEVLEGIGRGIKD